MTFAVDVAFLHHLIPKLVELSQPLANFAPILKMLPA
jgi:hypothetical protein